MDSIPKLPVHQQYDFDLGENDEPLIVIETDKDYMISSDKRKSFKQPTEAEIVRAVQDNFAEYGVSSKSKEF
jgi:hypothetical protein